MTYPKIKVNNQVTKEANRPRKKNKKPRNGCMSVPFTFIVKVDIFLRCNKPFNYSYLGSCVFDFNSVVSLFVH
jgi:hypothetical protein